MEKKPKKKYWLKLWGYRLYKNRQWNVEKNWYN